MASLPIWSFILAEVEKHLHIICLDVPYPPDYGGAIEIFYKIKYLHKAGVKIHLHCFDYGRGRPHQLSDYCEEVHFYPRRKLPSFHLPYIVISRKNKKLINRLRSDDYPILTEGIHCTYYVNNGALKGRKIWIRMHNIEHLYYRNLSATTGNFFKKIYLSVEALLLKRYEKALAKKTPDAHFLVLNHDEEKLLHQLGYQNVYYIPPFFQKPTEKVGNGKGRYCLYQGNLSVPENESAAVFLITQIFTQIDFPLVIAGKSPTSRMRKISKKYGIDLVPNPSNEMMQDLVANAQINIVYSLNNAGIKLKLLTALCNSRHVIANSAAVNGSGLEAICTVADEPKSLITAIKELFKKEFDDAAFRKRATVLWKNYDPEINARLLANLIFS